MLKRSIFFRVVAPTIVVSLVLLVSSTVVSIFLYKQQATTARDYGENVDSREADHLLEIRLSELNRLLHVAGEPGKVRVQADDCAQHVRELLAGAERYADKVEERELVAEIAASFQGYCDAWQASIDAPPEMSHEQLESAIKILETDTLPACVRLRDFNASQIKSSQSEHHANLERMIWGLPVVAGIGSLAGIFLGYGVARVLRQSLYRLSVRVRDAADKLGQDLPPVTLAGDGDLHGLNDQMTTVVQQVEQVLERLQQREREVLRAEQLAAVGQVAAGVAHELRNPLTSIKLLVQKNRRQVSAEGLPTENLQIIEQEIRRMERCLQTFLDFARPPKPERRLTDLASLIERTFVLIEGRARKQHVRLQFNHPKEVLTADVDPEQVHQLLVNLLLNALDAMPTGGTLTIEVVRGADSQAEIRVMDTGPGIAPQILPRLFEPFVSGKETGIGLGLVVSRRIAEEHGGELSAHNSTGHGACFTVSLPAAQQTLTERA